MTTICRAQLDRGLFKGVLLHRYTTVSKLLALLAVVAVLMFFQNTAYAAITYVASASNPADSSSLGASPVAVTPPGSMSIDDLVILVANSTVNSVAMSMSQTGGQQWTAQTNINSTGSQRIFWARFDGTWTSNPSVAFSDTTTTTVVMHVFRPSSGSNSWAIDVPQISSASTPSGRNDDVTIGGITTTTNGALVFATWTSTDNNQWILQTSGWANAGGAQYRNSSSNDASQSSAYKVMPSFGLSGSVVNRQDSRGPDDGNISILAFREVSLPAPIVTSISPPSGPTTGVTSVTIIGTNFTGATSVKFGGNNATSYTINSATQITATAPAGAGTVDVTVTTPGGTSATSAADQFTYLAAPIAEYRFDQTSGSTATDSSGNGLSGTLNGGVTVGGSGKVCTGYNFNGSNAFVSAPNTALLNPTQITVAAWVRHNTAAIKNWETILAKGDSAYRLHLLGQACSLNIKNTLGAFTFGVNGGCAGADVSSGKVPVSGMWYHVVGTYDGATIKIYVDGTLQGSAAYASTIASNTFPLYIGENAQQTGRHWSGDLDEVKIFSGALTAGQISAGYNNEKVGKNWDGTARVCVASGPDHYELSLPTTGITCLPTTVTVTACATGVPCNPMTILSGKTALLTTSAGALTSTTVTFNALGVASTTLSYPVASDGAVATVTLSGEQVAAINARKYCPDGANCVVGNSSSTTFKTAGFIFSTPADAAETTFSSQTAGVDFGPYWLRSVKTNPTTKACEAAFTAPHPVNFSYQCLDPASCSSGSWLKIGSSSLASSGATVNLAFDANGNASLGNFNFADVGQIKINASATAGGATLIGLTKEAVGSHFVIKPYSLVLTDIKQTASPNLANPAALNAAGNKFVKAGESFSATVTSVNASCAASLSSYATLSSIPATCITPNYGKEAAPETVALSNALVPGLGLSANPALANATAFAAFSGGSATGTTFSWGDVGIIKLTPGVGDGNYLGAGDISGTISSNVGRFYAAKFALSGGSIANRTDIAVCGAGCGVFTYMGEPMSALFSLTAKAVDGTTTLLNYNWSATAANQFAKLDPLAVVTAGTGGSLGMGAVDSAATRTPFTPCGVVPAHPCLTPALTTTGTFASGVANVTVPFTIYRDTATPRGPYALLDIGVGPQDSDGALTAYDLDTVNLVAGASNHTLVGRTQARFGVLKMSNMYGSERLPLDVPIQAQYFDATSSTFKLNTDDARTALSVPPVIAPRATGTALDGTPGLYFYTVDPAVNGKNKLASTDTIPTLASPLTAGKSNLHFPMPSNRGWLDIILNVPGYLKYNWGNCNGQGIDTLLNDFPCSRATFGIYKSPLIYRRENY